MDKDNISFKNIIHSHLTSFKIYKINPIIFYCGIIFLNFFIFKNYYKTLRQIKKRQFPVKFTFRNDQSVDTNDLREASLLLSRCKGIKFKDEEIIINDKKYNLQSFNKF